MILLNTSKKQQQKSTELNQSISHLLNIFVHVSVFQQSTIKSANSVIYLLPFQVSACLPSKCVCYQHTIQMQS